MRRHALALFSLACLSGCYTVNQERFSAYAASAVSAGTPLAAATARLQKDGFHCDPRSSAPATTCTRDRQSLLPYTCIERINLFPREDGTTIARVEVPQIMCAGL